MFVSFGDSILRFVCVVTILSRKKLEVGELVAQSLCVMTVLPRRKLWAVEMVGRRLWNLRDVGLCPE